MTTRRRTGGVPHHPKEGVVIHGDSRIRYHGTRAEATKAGPELAMLAESFGKHHTYAVERCPYCASGRAFVVIRYPRTAR